MTPSRVLIVGHGKAGRALAADTVARGSFVVGFLDDTSDAPEVLGRLADVNRVVRENAIELVYFAIPTIEAEALRTFLQNIDLGSVDFAMLPRTYEIVARDTVHIDDLTDIDILQLVGRQPVRHEALASAEFIGGKTALVTGAAGSIGSRVVRRLVELGARRIVCVDRWENGLFYLGQELGDRESISIEVADVQSAPRIHNILETYRPHIVFHTAAYKHVPMMQHNAVEAVNNNVWGSLNMMRQSIEAGVENFVYVSTDKAVNPANVMGTTKRLGEMLFESLSDGTHSTRFTGVRFGNVLESEGSVMQIFRRQIAQKKPLTVTHKDITRFFMTIDEASQLIIQSATLGREAELFVLDMGEPVRIYDLAQSLVQAVDPSIDIIITGLRPGEKMYEELSYTPDDVDSTSFPKIFAVRGEGNFDRGEFMSWVENLVERCRAYNISNDEVVASLRERGFAIQ